MDYAKLIGNWHKKASLQEDPFSGFVFEYLAFIAYLRTQCFTDTSKDRQAIQKLKQSKYLEEKYLRKVESEQLLKGEWESIITELKKKPLRNDSEPDNMRWWNCSNDDPKHKTHDEEGRKTGTIYSPQDWENMVEFLYTIRNNLFHAEKDPKNERDLFLVEHGRKVLKKFVDVLSAESEPR